MADRGDPAALVHPQVLAGALGGPMCILPFARTCTASAGALAAGRGGRAGAWCGAMEARPRTTIARTASAIGVTPCACKPSISGL